MPNSKNKSRSALVAELIQSMMAIGRSGHSGDGGLILHKHGFSMPQLPMLFHINASENGSSVKEIAARLNVTSSAATQLIQTLLRRGVLKKTVNSSDRRALYINFTPAGKKEFAAFRKDMLSRMEKSFSVVPDAELEEMNRVFQKILTYIKPSNTH